MSRSRRGLAEALPDLIADDSDVGTGDETDQLASGLAARLKSFEFMLLTYGVAAAVRRSPPSASLSKSSSFILV